MTGTGKTPSEVSAKIMGLILEGATPLDIDAIAQADGWTNTKEDTAACIARAENELRKRGQGDRGLVFGKTVARLTALFSAALVIQDYKTCLAVQKELNQYIASPAATKTPTGAELIPQPHSGALSAGNPGNKGGTGRPTDQFIAIMKELASSPEAVNYLRDCVNGLHGAQAAVSAHKHLSERGYGKVAQVIEANVAAPIAMTITRRIVDPANGE